MATRKTRATRAPGGKRAGAATARTGTLAAKRPAPAKRPASAKRPAAGGEDRLWAIVARVNATAQGELAASCAAFTAELEALGDADVVAVEAAFAQAMRRAYRWDLRSAAYLIHGGCGDDAFGIFAPA
ncbi:MAG: DUF4240 domain-containing protein [Deltaproteobacteria bacterium]|nr:DUF4240 domain-containing protein [Deltaproteobacteria bacterium]